MVYLKVKENATNIVKGFGKNNYYYVDLITRRYWTQKESRWEET